MNKIYATCIIGFVAWCAAAQACSPRLDGEPTFCPPFDGDLPSKPTLPREEMRGDIDVWNPHHLIQMEQMFMRNARRTQIEKNMTLPYDAINNALDDFWEQKDGSNGSTKQKELLQLSSDGD
jgi:hypothetical protein